MWRNGTVEGLAARTRAFLVTRGGEGADEYLADGCRHHPVYPVDQVVDTNGGWELPAFTQVWLACEVPRQEAASAAMLSHTGRARDWLGGGVGMGWWSHRSAARAGAYCKAPTRPHRSCPLVCLAGAGDTFATAYM